MDTPTVRRRAAVAFCGSTPHSLYSRPTVRRTAVCGGLPLKRLRPQRAVVCHQFQTQARRSVGFVQKDEQAGHRNGQQLKTGSRAPAAPTASLLMSLSSLASTGAGIFVLGFIVFVHESGHFIAARTQGIRVKNFSIGFGPTMLRYTPKKSETEFTLRLLPLGGYVAFPEHVSRDSETGEEAVDTDPDLLQNRPVLDRAIVVSAGVIANLILAWSALLWSVVAVGVPTYDVHAGVAVSSIVDNNGPAARAGLRSGDVIMQLDGTPVGGSLKSAASVADRIRGSKGAALTLRLSRVDEADERDVRVFPRCDTDGLSSIGVQLMPNATVVRSKPTSVPRTLQMTNAEFIRVCQQTWQGFVSLARNVQESSRTLSGPIGVVSMGADLARNDTAALLTFCAVISVNLALINALPLPALDGGQMAFLVVEAVRGTPVSLRVQEAINQTALLLLLMFSGVLFLGDLERLELFGALRKLLG